MKKFALLLAFVGVQCRQIDTAKEDSASRSILGSGTEVDAGVYTDARRTTYFGELTAKQSNAFKARQYTWSGDLALARVHGQGVDINGTATVRKIDDRGAVAKATTVPAIHTLKDSLSGLTYKFRPLRAKIRDEKSIRLRIVGGKFVAIATASTECQKVVTAQEIPLCKTKDVKQKGNSQDMYMIGIQPTADASGKFGDVEIGLMYEGLKKEAIRTVTDLNPINGQRYEQGVLVRFFHQVPPTPETQLPADRTPIAGEVQSSETIQQPGEQSNLLAENSCLLPRLTDLFDGTAEANSSTQGQGGSTGSAGGHARRVAVESMEPAAVVTPSGQRIKVPPELDGTAGDEWSTQGTPTVSPQLPSTLATESTLFTVESEGGGNATTTPATTPTAASTPAATQESDKVENRPTTDFSEYNL